MDMRYVFSSLETMVSETISLKFRLTRRFYKDSDPSLPMVKCERTCLFHWSMSLDKMMQKYIKPTFVVSTQISKIIRAQRQWTTPRLSIM